MSARNYSLKRFGDTPKNLTPATVEEPIYGPERRLIAAIISRAVLDVAHPELAVRLGARRWIISASHKEFSFLWCLQKLSLERLTKKIRSLALKIVPRRGDRFEEGRNDIPAKESFPEHQQATAILFKHDTTKRLLQFMNEVGISGCPLTVDEKVLSENESSVSS